MSNRPPRPRRAGALLWLALALQPMGSLPVAAQAGRPATLDPERVLVFDENVADAGEAYQLGVVEYAFGFGNRGDRPLAIRSVVALDAAGEASADPAEIQPGGRGAVRVRQPLGVRLGLQRFGFDVASDDPRAPIQRLVLVVFSQSAYDDERPFVDFGLLDRAEGKRVEMELGSREVASIELEAVVAVPEFIQVQAAGRSGVAGERLMLEFRVLPGAPRGHRAGAIHLRTNVPRQPDWIAAFQAAVFDDVVPEPTFLQLGAVRRGESFARDVRLVSRSGRPFAVLGVDDASGRARVDAANCAGGNTPDRCWALRVRVESVQEGTLRGELAIRIAGDGEPLPLPYAGLVAAPDARIEDLGAVDDTTKRREADSREPAP